MAARRRVGYLASREVVLRRLGWALAGLGLAVGAELAGARAWLATSLPRSQAEASAAAACGRLTPTALVRLVRADEPVACAATWWVEQLGQGAPGLRASLRPLLSSPSARVRLRAALLLRALDEPVGAEIAEALRSVDERALADEVAARLDPEAAWVDPGLADRLRAAAWWVRSETPPDAVGLLRREAWGWTEPTDHALQAALRGFADREPVPEGPRVRSRSLAMPPDHLPAALRADCPRRPTACRLAVAALVAEREPEPETLEPPADEPVAMGPITSAWLGATWGTADARAEDAHVWLRRWGAWWAQADTEAVVSRIGGGRSAGGEVDGWQGALRGGAGPWSVALAALLVAESGGLRVTVAFDGEHLWLGGAHALRVDGCGRVQGGKGDGRPLAPRVVLIGAAREAAAAGRPEDAARWGGIADRWSGQPAPLVPRLGLRAGGLLRPSGERVEVPALPKCDDG